MAQKYPNPPPTQTRPAASPPPPKKVHPEVDEKKLTGHDRAHRIASVAAEELIRSEGAPTNSPDEYLIPQCQADDHMRDCIAHLYHHGLAVSHELNDGYIIVQFGDFTLGAGWD